MPKTVTKTLSFPLAGIARRFTYRRQPRPYATPYAQNMRGVGSLERRERGGSRPGLTKVSTTDFGTSITSVNSVTSIDGDGGRVRSVIVIADGNLYVVEGATAESVSPDLLWDDGEVVLWDDGNTIIFDSTVTAANPVTATGAHHTAESGGNLYLADSTLRVFNPITGIAAVVPNAPSGCPLICMYRDRMILASDHLWYASKQGDFEDWDFGATFEDSSRAVAGEVSFSGIIGEPIKALIPFRDQYLVFACENSLWLLKGDPATGTLQNLSGDVGIISPEAWAITPGGMLSFLSNDGVYVGGVNETPQRFSAERLPDNLRNVDPDTNNISMVYNAVDRGFHLFVAADNSWFFDIANKAVWKDTFATTNFPVATSQSEGNGIREVVMGCSDGYLRKFSSAAYTDDDTPFESVVVLGPFRMSHDDVADAMLAELHGILSDNSGTVRWNVFAANTAEECADKSESIHNASASGIWSDNRNKVSRTRVRGQWFAISLRGYSMWSFEAIAVVARQLGRLR